MRNQTKLIILSDSMIQSVSSLCLLCGDRACCQLVLKSVVGGSGCCPCTCLQYLNTGRLPEV